MSAKSQQEDPMSKVPDLDSIVQSIAGCQDFKDLMGQMTTTMERVQDTPGIFNPQNTAASHSVDENEDEDAESFKDVFQRVFTTQDGRSIVDVLDSINTQCTKIVEHIEKS